MSPHYETAAHTLLFLNRSGMLMTPGTDCRKVVARLAWMIDRRQSHNRDLSHAGAAIWMLDELVRLKFVSFEKSSRPKLLAIIGTSIGNLDIGRRAHL